MTTVVELPDDVVVQLKEHAAERGLTIAEFIREIAQRPTGRQALEAFIGSADVAFDDPFDIHKARAELADELLREHDALNEGRVHRPPRSSGRSPELD